MIIWARWSHSSWPSIRLKCAHSTCPSNPHHHLNHLTTPSDQKPKEQSYALHRPHVVKDRLVVVVVGEGVVGSQGESRAVVVVLVGAVPRLCISPLLVLGNMCPKPHSEMIHQRREALPPAKCAPLRNHTNRSTSCLHLASSHFLLLCPSCLHRNISCHYGTGVASTPYS